jgi:hypothetical protein
MQCDYSAVNCGRAQRNRKTLPQATFAPCEKPLSVRLALNWYKPSLPQFSCKYAVLLGAWPLQDTEIAGENVKAK